MLGPRSCWRTGGFTPHLSHGNVPFTLGASRTPWQPNPQGCVDSCGFSSQTPCKKSLSVDFLFFRKNSFNLGTSSASAGATHCLFPPWKGNSKDLGHFPSSSLTPLSPLWLHYFDFNLENIFKSPIMCKNAVGWCKAHLYNQMGLVFCKAASLDHPLLCLVYPPNSRDRVCIS